MSIPTFHLKKSQRRRRPQTPNLVGVVEDEAVGAGRRSAWENGIKDQLDLIEGWCRRGYTEESIADQLGISYPTWWKTKKDHPVLQEAVDRGRKDSVVLVENALFRECIGYHTTEVKKTIAGYDSKGNPIVTEYVEKRVFNRPTVGAQMFFLVNRHPDRWKNTRTVVQEGGSKPLQFQAVPGLDLSKLPQDKLDSLEELLRDSLVSSEAPAQLAEEAGE